MPFCFHPLNYFATRLIDSKLDQPTPAVMLWFISKNNGHVCDQFVLLAQIGITGGEGGI